MGQKKYLKGLWLKLFNTNKKLKSIQSIRTRNTEQENHDENHTQVIIIKLLEKKKKKVLEVAKKKRDTVSFVIIRRVFL